MCRLWRVPIGRQTTDGASDRMSESRSRQDGGAECKGGASFEMTTNKPKDEYRCEASTGWEMVGSNPRINTCGKPAKLYGIAALCDEHKDILKKYPQAVPREKPSTN